MKRILNIAFFILLIYFLLLSFADINYLLSIVSSFVFPVLLIFFFRKIDVFEKEKYSDLFYVFIVGCTVSFFLSSFIYVPLRNLIVQENQCANFFNCFLLVAIPEEIIKIIPLIYVLKFKSFVNEPIDYLIYSSIGALGFAFIENIDYIQNYSETGNIVAVRSFLPLIMHISTSSILGFSVFLYMNSNRIKYILYALIFSSVLHAAYNSLIIRVLVLIFLIIVFAKLIQSLLNISPFYDESKEKDIVYSSNFLLIILFIVFTYNIINDIILLGINHVLNNFYNYIFIIFYPFIFYRLISSRLSLKKANFVALGSRSTKINLFKEMQDIIISYYKSNFK